MLLDYVPYNIFSIERFESFEGLKEDLATQTLTEIPQTHKVEDVDR